MVHDEIMYLLQEDCSSLDRPNTVVQVIFLDFSSAFNTIQAQAAEGQTGEHAGGIPPHYMGR